MSNRRGILFTSIAGAAVLATASAAFACVTFMGQMEVDGDNGSTEVVGTGNSHGYCSDGRPKTAAAGQINDLIKIKVSPGKCEDDGAALSHKLPEGTYQVRYNNEVAYTYGVDGDASRLKHGTYWNMLPQLGCFHPNNVDTAMVIGTFAIDALGYGSWSGTLSGFKQDPVYATPLTASNICIGPKNGLLAPYQLLAI